MIEWYFAAPIPFGGGGDINKCMYCRERLILKLHKLKKKTILEDNLFCFPSSNNNNIIIHCLKSNMKEAQWTQCLCLFLLCTSRLNISKKTLIIYSYIVPLTYVLAGIN